MTRFTCLLTLLVLFPHGLPAAEPPAKPNIVFILTDDQGWADIGYHGSDVKTPHLDRLAAEGVRLNQHYVYPTCSPTRVALIGGRYPSRYGVLSPLGATTHMKGTDAHLPRALQSLGYKTHISGKWHIGETPEHRPLNYGFTTSYGYLRGQIDPYTHRYKFGDHVTWHRNDEFIEEAGHVTDLITDEAIRVIEEAGDEPFFLYVAHHSPHYPLNEPPKWIAPYDETIEDVWRRHFAAAITHVDHDVGRIIEALERTDKRQNTLIIYSSDNGGQRDWSAPDREYNGRYAAHRTLGNNEPLRGWKGDVYDGGIRVPAFVNWPGILESGRILDAPTHTCDWAPTLIRLAGGEPQQEWQLDGLDIWPQLSDSRHQPEARTMYWRTPRRSAIRSGDWKLVTDRNHQNPELFHLAEDPYEQTDRADKMPERVQELTKLLDEHRAGDWSER
jgi:arylsulfatase A-like enzyme